ncbi:MAG: acyl-CoA/acyl-ACP dehydrogenase [Alphaproteobacteria bacterium]|nr:acyl-CoA/acyl-ACP dehydrogenase [Alphaproteobacteria bacterium]
MSDPTTQPETSIVLPDLLGVCASSLEIVESYVESARARVSDLVSVDAKISGSRLNEEQFAAHGLSWIMTYATGLRELLRWAERLDQVGKFNELEALILQAAFGEYINQLRSGIAISQGEIVRPGDLGMRDTEIAPLSAGASGKLMSNGNTNQVRMRIATLIEDGDFGNPAYGDETLEMIAEQFRRFADEQIIPSAHEWHRKDQLIPMEIIDQMSQMGVFGLTVPEEYGGHGLGKVSMCVVTEELSRGYIGVGSLGTRPEIACELIRLGGTEDQKKYWLPKLASGEILPTAVFTEPGTGSDLGSLKARAERDGDVYRIRGNKTWITHAARTDVMTLLVRTNPDEPGYKGLSMFIAPKPRGDDDNPFPAQGMSGGEIGVLGYRGMKEYEIAFDGFEVEAKHLLGEQEGEGFKQLMATFESARIQTAARSVGVAQRAMELAREYAVERQQFKRSIYKFPRVAGKIAWMAVETMIARQLSYFAAREKDSDRRCDIEAGMAKLLAARVAWSNADNAVQVHGGNGYAEEFEISRVLCDARILNIFEGAAEIQAHVIARGLLERRN